MSESRILPLLVALALLYVRALYEDFFSMTPRLPSPPHVSYSSARDWAPEDPVSLSQLVGLMRKEIREQRVLCMLAPDVNVDLRVAVLSDGSALINPHATNRSVEVHFVVNDVNGEPVETLVHNWIEYEYLAEFLEPKRTVYVKTQAECLQQMLK